ncbi:MAG: hypothetical protein IT440_01215 [Phycisphaeraceae bacterium]|nr:hypothetical protein [Phycisphaeraceae bacterium]
MTKKTIRRISGLLALLASAWLAGQAYAQAQPKATLHLPFDGNTTPAVSADAAAVHLLKKDSPVEFVEGVKGQAVRLKDNVVICPVAGNLSPTQGTICFWAKPLDWDPQQPETIWRTFWCVQTRIEGEGRNDWMSFWRYSEEMSKPFKSVGSYNYAAQADELNNCIFDIGDWKKGQWRFFAMTWDKDGSARLYQDGKKTHQLTRQPASMLVNLNFIQIVGSGSAMDEFKVYDAAMTDDHVMEQYMASADAARKSQSSENAAIFAQSPFITASPLSAAPKLDGSGDDPVWSRCIDVADVAVLSDRTLPRNATSFRVGYTKDKLYILAQCDCPGTNPRPAVRDHDGQVYTEDSVELYIEPVAGSGKYFQFASNALGTRYEGQAMDKSWNGDWETAASSREGRWLVECAIPFASLGLEPKPGAALGFNFTRNDTVGNQNISWADLGGGAYHNPAKFGRLILGDQAVGFTGVAVPTRDGQSIVVRGQVDNGDAAAHAVQWLMRGIAGGDAFDLDAQGTVNPGQSWLVDQVAVAQTSEGSQVGWRSAMLVDGQARYVSWPVQAPMLSLPVLDRPREPLVLANAKVRLVFDANTGALVSLHQLQAGRELLASQSPVPLFRLDAVNFQKTPMFFRETDVLTLTPSLRTFRSAKVTKESDKQILTVLHQFDEGVKVTTTISLGASDQTSQWGINVENALPRRPRDGVIVHRVAYPLLSGLKAADSDADQALALPDCIGRLVREPAGKLKDPVKLDVPGWASMSWMDLSGPTGGIYLASHDLRPAISTLLEAQGQSTGHIDLTITRWSVLWPGNTWQPQPCSVGLHTGDWHWSADQYRAWYEAAVTPRPTPAWVLAEDGWVMDGGGRNRSTFQNIDRTLTMARVKGFNYVQSWQHHGDFNFTEVIGYYLPNLYGGTEQQFIDAIHNVHQQGGRIGFYFDIGDMELRLGQLLHQPQYMQKLTEEHKQHIPAADPLSDGWLDSAIMNADGSYRIGWPSGIDTWHGCLGSTKGWGPWYAYCLDQFANKYKADTWYADIFPGYATGMCFNPRHGHPCPASVGQIALDFGERFVKTVDKDFGILGEGFNDRFFTFQTHALWCIGVHREDTEPAIFLYSHPRFPLFGGTCSYTWGAPSALYKKLLGIGPLTFSDHMRYMLLYGLRFDTYPGTLYPDHAALLGDEKQQQDLILLRRAVHQDFDACDFRDRVGLGDSPANTQSRLFIRRDHAGGLITIFDARDDKAAFTLTLSQQRHNMETVAGAELCLPGGTTQAMPTPTVHGDDVVFQIPKTEARMMIVRFIAQPASIKPVK